VPHLVVEKGPDKGLSVEIPDGAAVVRIGRGSACALRLHDTLASRVHCAIESKDRRFYVRDASSRNGTFLNGRRIVLCELALGDQILVGETLVTFQAEPATVDPLVGKDIDGYRIIELIGKGGMGKVYKALQLSLDRIVALKILSKQYANNTAFIERFRREARALAKLNHPNVVPVYDVGECSGLHYFSMEYMPGGSVAQRISGGRRLPPHIALRMVLDAAQGLAYAEAKGVVHRDIKPENMMLDAAENVKLCDLGIAQTIEEGPWKNAGKGVFGSPHYMAPEQARGEHTDHRADIYALGASFYRIVTGSTLFKAPSAREIVLKQINEQPAPVASLAHGIHPGYAGIIEKMIEKDLSLRYQSARDVVDDLRRLQHRTHDVRPSPAATDLRRRKPRRAARFSIFVILALLAGVLLGIGFIALRHYAPGLFGQAPGSSAVDRPGGGT